MLHHRRTSSNISRWNFIKTGLLIVALSLCFIYDRSFFFYPPNLAPAWNNIYFDAVGLIFGIILLLCGLFDWNNNFVISISLAVITGFLAVLIVAESFHIFGAGFFRFHPSVVLEIYAIVNIMQIAYERTPER